jgi:hypothetical protein
MRALAEPGAGDCDIAGAVVDCDIAGPGLASFELLQAARVKAIVNRAAPLSAVYRMSFTFRFARGRALCGWQCRRYKAIGDVGDTA